MESMQQELVVRWYQDYGEWVWRIVLGVAIAFLSYGLLSLWPVYSPGIIILCAVVLGLVGAERPGYALRGFFLAFAPSFLYGSGSLAVVFILFFLLVLSIPKIADTPLKVTLVLSTPFALHFGWFFFAAIIGGLVYANAAVIQSAVGAMLAFSVAWLRGWHIIGVSPHEPPGSRSQLSR